MMENQDRLFDQQVREAYERIEMSDEAQERVLANLLVAQARRDASNVVQVTPTGGNAKAAVDEPAETSAHESCRRKEGRVLTLPGWRRRWKVWLPAAAAVAAALVVVRLVGAPANMSADSAAEKVVANATLAPVATDGETAAEEKAMEYADEPAMEDEGSALVEETVAVADALETVDYYPLITLEDGTLLTALVDGLYTVPVEESRVGELVGEATARPTDAFETVSCKVYRLVDDDQGYAVCYGDEKTYWYCTEPDL